jgi:ATP-binding cassette subfamily B protein
MDDLCLYVSRPLGFMARYIVMRPFSHGLILLAVLGAVGCSVGAQYGVRSLVDALSGAQGAMPPWSAFALLATLIASDNMLWRVASFTASHAFVRVTGDLRRDLFRHLTGHPPGYFAERVPGVLTSRITATSNAFFAVENMFVWNVLPPCVATAAAIALVSTVSSQMAEALVVVASIVVVAMFRIAAAGKPLHHEFANTAAAVDGEMIDVIGNLSLVKSFGGLHREHRRFDEVVGREMIARRRSLIYLERLRLLHASVTVLLALFLLAWAIRLWQEGGATAGQVVLVCTLGLSVLYATRDLAIALVDVTQHLARLSEALATLLPERANALPGFQPAHRAGPTRRPHRQVRGREVDALCAAAALLRGRKRAHPHRRPGYHQGHAGEPARGHGGRAAGHLAVQPFDPREYPLQPARGLG